MTREVVGTRQTQGFCQLVRAGNLQSTVFCVAVVQVQTGAVRDDLVVLVHVVRSHLVFPGIRGAFQAQLNAVDLDGIQIGDILRVLQTVQFGRLRCPVALVQA